METFGLERDTGRKRNLGARELAREQGRGWRKRKAGRDTHRDTGSKKERKENRQGRMGERDGKLGKRIHEQGEEGCERKYALGDRREGRFHGGE